MTVDSSYDNKSTSKEQKKRIGLNKNLVRLCIKGHYQGMGKTAHRMGENIFKLYLTRVCNPPYTKNSHNSATKRQNPIWKWEKTWGAWGAQTVGRPTSVQVMISLLMSSSPVLGSADSSEPGACFGFSVCVSLSSPSLLALCLSLSLSRSQK